MLFFKSHQDFPGESIAILKSISNPTADEKIGTADEKGIIKKDASGTDVQEVIGNQEADFRVGLVSNFRYKNFGVYMLWDWKQGGDVYNGNEYNWNQDFYARNFIR